MSVSSATVGPASVIGTDFVPVLSATSFPFPLNALTTSAFLPVGFVLPAGRWILQVSTIIAPATPGSFSYVQSLALNWVNSGLGRFPSFVATQNLLNTAMVSATAQTATTVNCMVSSDGTTPLVMTISGNIPNTPSPACFGAVAVIALTVGSVSIYAIRLA